MQPGNAASAQLCKQCRDVQDAWNAMNGQPCCTEFKFDGTHNAVEDTSSIVSAGYRLMLHRTAAGQVHYFTRQGNNFRDQRQYHLLDPLVEQQLLPDVPFVLDGELCTWNKAKYVSLMNAPCANTHKVHNIKHNNMPQRRYFEPFNCVSAVLTAIKEQHAPDRTLITGGHHIHLIPDPEYQRPQVQDVELVYIAFDVLFCGEHGCVTHLPLSERHALLRTMLQPGCPDTITVCAQHKSVCVTHTCFLQMANPHVSGRIALMLPDEPFLGGAPVCQTCKGPEDIQNMLDRSMFNEDEQVVSLMYIALPVRLLHCAPQEHTALAAEGVVVKNLSSQWIPNDRSNSWLKIKPDYLHKHDLDAVVVGSFFSKGMRGQDHASLTQFLLALPDRGEGEPGPVQWLTFCKYGMIKCHAHAHTIYSD